MAKKYAKARPGTCPRIRRQLFTSRPLNPFTGETGEERQEWVTGPCGTPLFGEDLKRGICRPCASGWTHPHNYPVDD